MINNLLIVLLVCAGISACAILVSQLSKLVGGCSSLHNLNKGYESGFSHKNRPHHYNKEMNILILPYMILELLVIWAIYGSINSSQFLIPVVLFIACLSYFNVK